MTRTTNRSDFLRAVSVVGSPADWNSFRGLHSSRPRSLPGNMSPPAAVPEPSPSFPSSGQTSM
ncbi:MAG TPA: hypothetical protein VF520_03600 [Thermoleophilaceae bacterium]